MFLLACSFHAGGGAGGGGPGSNGNGTPDARATADATPAVDAKLIDASTLPDAPPPPDAAWCSAGVTSTTGSDRGHVGGNGGGSNFPPLTCDRATDLIVGVAVDMSDQSTTNGGISARGIVIECAPVAIDPGGGGHLGSSYTHEVEGNGNGKWSPDTLGATAECPAGAVMSGLQAFTVNGRLFQNVTLTCSQLAADGTPGATTIVAVPGTLASTQGKTTATCGSGEVVARVPNGTGDGLDSVDLDCAPSSCQ